MFSHANPNDKAAKWAAANPDSVAFLLYAAAERMRLVNRDRRDADDIIATTFALQSVNAEYAIQTWRDKIPVSADIEPVTPEPTDTAMSDPELRDTTTSDPVPPLAERDSPVCCPHADRMHTDIGCEDDAVGDRYGAMCKCLRRGA